MAVSVSEQSYGVNNTLFQVISRDMGCSCKQDYLSYQEDSDGVSSLIFAIYDALRHWRTAGGSRTRTPMLFTNRSSLVDARSARTSICKMSVIFTSPRLLRVQDLVDAPVRD